MKLCVPCRQVVTCAALKGSACGPPGALDGSTHEPYAACISALILKFHQSLAATNGGQQSRGCWRFHVTLKDRLGQVTLTVNVLH
jgi:hypothetical protein